MTNFKIWCKIYLTQILYFVKIVKCCFKMLMAHKFEDDMTHANFTSDQLNDMESVIDNFFTKNKIQISLPIDSIALAKSMGFKVFSADLGGEADALIAVNEEIHAIEDVGSNKLIVYNRSIASEEHIRFVIAHELAHYITEKEKGNNVVFAERVNVHGDKKSFEEQKMDYLAASILVPKTLLQSLLDRLKYKDTDNDIKELYKRVLSNLFKVSPSLMTRRIEEIDD